MLSIFPLTYNHVINPNTQYHRHEKQISISYDGSTYTDKQNTSTKIQINKIQPNRQHTIAVKTL